MGGALLPPDGGFTGSLGWRFLVTVGAVHLHVGHFLCMRDFSDVSVAVSAGLHVVVFHEESACRIMHLGSVGIARWSPICIFMTFHAGFIVTQIFGKGGRSKPQRQQGNEGYG